MAPGTVKEMTGPTLVDKVRDLRRLSAGL